MVELTDIPTNTSGSVNVGDIYGGTFAIFSSAAAETETSEGSPDIAAVKTVSLYDPGGSGLYAVPGVDVIYDIHVSNSGTSSPDADSIFIVDNLPTDVIFYNGDIDDGGPETNPIAFIDYGSGLTLNYAADVGYSNAATPPADLSACNYTPAIGYDPNVTHICFQPSGTMASSSGTPACAVQFRTKIK